MLGACEVILLLWIFINTSVISCKIGHVKVASFYALLQLAVSLGFIYLCPALSAATGLSLVAWHWIYLVAALVVLAVAYVLFMRKFYHLHEESLASLK